MKKLHVYSNGQWQAVSGAVAETDLTNYYTKPEVDQALANAATGGSVDLSAYAKLNDTEQDITAKSVTAEAVQAVGVQFISQNAPNTALLRADVGGQERLVYAVGSKKFPIAFTSELTGGGSVDLSAYAKLEDSTQNFLAKSVTAQAVGFGDTLTPNFALAYTDTGEGYGSRLVTVSTGQVDYVVLKSDLDELNALLPRVESLENRAAPVVESVDLSPYALKSDLLGLATETSVAATYLTKSDARIYTTAADVAAAMQANYTSKADHKSLADTVQIIFTNTYTKVEVDDLIARTPSPMKYLQWGGVFQKIPAANAKDKWTAAGLLPSIQIVKGKHYRLEMTLKFGPLNTDVLQAWVGFRFNYKALNELPCTKQPLVTMGGWGTTTVTRARANIAATAPATTTPTRANRFRFCCVDDWISAEDIIEYAVEFEADQDIASANFVPEICFGGSWLTFPTNFEGVVAVFRQMD